MYRVLKDKGNNSNVILENVETRASIIIGRLSMEIVAILAEDGKSLRDEDLKDIWQLEISNEAGKKLAGMALKMNKPIRDQRKAETKKAKNKTIDAMDVLLGLASYN